jgi:hypothetical protein
MCILLSTNTILIGEECERMLVVGVASSIEEQEELHFIAEIAIIGERIRVLARQQKTDKKD